MKIIKTITGIVFGIIITGAVCVCAYAAAPEVSYGSPKVDGKKDEIYETMQPIETKKVVSGSSIEDPSSAKAWLAWDNEGLYVYAEVRETTPANEANEEYNQDSVEIFTDEDCSKGGAIDANDTQYRVTSLGSRTLGNAASNDFLSAASTADNGYTVEMKLPWLEILPTEGTVIGFDIMVNDALGAVRQGMRAWSAEANTNYVSTESYGEIRLVFGESYVPWNGTDPLRVSINGYRLDCGETDPVVKDDRTLVPMRAIFEALGSGVAYNEKENAVYAIGNGKLIKLVIDSDTVYINNEPQKLEVPATTINDRTVVPLRFIAETLGADVDYSEEQGIVFISK